MYRLEIVSFRFVSQISVSQFSSGGYVKSHNAFIKLYFWEFYMAAKKLYYSNINISQAIFFILILTEKCAREKLFRLLNVI